MNTPDTLPTGSSPLRFQKQVLEQENTSTIRPPLDFEWLADLQNSPCYTEFNAKYPAKSADFGSNGFTGSVTDWHELLQITAPDDKCGLVFVRGDHPNTPDAILARSQRRDDSGSKGTFGLNLLADESDFDLGEKITQGMANFKWPYTKYELRRKSKHGAGRDRPPSGTYEMISFVKDGSIFQVIRIKPGRLNKFEPSRGDEIERSPSGHSRKFSAALVSPEPIDLEPKSQRSPHQEHQERDKVPSSSHRRHECGFIKFKIGGRVQFGCVCSNGGSSYKTKHSWSPPSDETGMYCSNSYYEKRLDFELFVDGESERLSPALSNSSERDFFVDISSKTRSIPLSSETPTILVCAYSLREEPAGTNSGKPSTGISSPEMERFLGIEHRSVDMTDRLWAACVLPNYDVDEADEVCAIARNVEEILCVSSLPVPRHIKHAQNGYSTPPLQDVSNQQQLLDRGEVPLTSTSRCAIALIRNIVTSQYIDLQSSFWQLRFLVKVRIFLRSRSLRQDDLLDKKETDYLTRVRSRYISKIDEHIRSVILWVAQIDLNNDATLYPARNRDSIRYYCSSRRSKTKPDDTYKQCWYATMMVWYVMKHCPDAITEDFKQYILVPWLCQPTHQANAASDFRDDGLGETESRKADLLQWFHASCFLLLCQTLLHDIQDRSVKEILALQKVQMEEVKKEAEATVKRWRKGQNDLYSPADEEVDRLILLGDEELEPYGNSTTSKLAEVRAKQARTRISERRFTQTFHPGPTVSTPSRRSPRMVTNAPWELALLNHHSLLRIALKDGSKSLVDKSVRNACFEFILADYTFMTSWDRGCKDMIGQWWDFEPNSVICSTIIDLKMGEKLKSAPSESQAKNNKTHEPDDQSMVDPPKNERQNTAEGQALWDVLSEWKRDKALKQDRLVSVRSPSNTSGSPFDWVKRKPARIYYPDVWIRSIDDTPGQFHSEETKKVQLGPKITRYLEKKNQLASPQYTKDNIRSDLRQHDISVFSAFDYTLTEGFTFTKERTSFQNSTVINDKEKLMLVDSLVDLGTKHRILFTRRCCPSIVKGFYYLWHPDARDTFDNHFGTASRFSDTKESTWITTITISHWTFNPELKEMFDEWRLNKGTFPPSDVRRPTPRVDQKDHSSDIRNFIEEGCSSLVITGDQHGYFWICSAWSSLTNDESLSKELEKLPKILKIFLYQQASGRNLVFLLLLGHFCEKLQSKYEDVLDDLNQFCELGPTAMTKGLDWRTDTEDRLDRMFWAQEALRILEVSVSSALNQIERAKEKMDRTIKRAAGQLHNDILQEYSNVMGDFEQQYLGLAGIRTEMQLKKQQVTSLRDSISTLTNVTDNRITIKQGKNIKVLTRITIAYLPFTLITGLFSVDREAHILPQNAGLGMFFGLIAVCVIVTESIALSIWERWNLKDRVRSVSAHEFRDQSTLPQYRSEEAQNQTSSIFGPRSGTSDHHT